MKVAVAGGFGFLGRHVVTRLQQRGNDVVPFSRRTGIDLRDFDRSLAFLQSERPEIVINCAAHVGGIAYNQLKPIEVYEDNLMIGFNIARACVEAPVGKLVNIMPNCTYPGVAEIYREDEWWNGPMHDSVLTYGMPRKAIWVQCWAYKQKTGFNSIHLILPNLYGPGDHFDPVKSHALGALIQKIVDAKLTGRREVVIWGTGTPIREWGYVEDAAEGIVLAMEGWNEIDVLNVGTGTGYTILDVALMIKEVVGFDGEFRFDRSRPDGAPKKVLDVRKMRSVLGWEPPTDIRDGIRKTVEWYLATVSQRQPA